VFKLAKWPEGISTEDLVRWLRRLQEGASEFEEAQYEGELDDNTLARLLRPFEIKPKGLRFRMKDGERKQLRGYKREWFEPQWDRYLPADPVTPVTPVTP
jgi:hypothetical protein